MIVTLKKALSLAISRLHQPVITLYQFATVLNQLYATAKFQGEEIAGITRTTANTQSLGKQLNQLLEDGILHPLKGFPEKSVFSVFGKDEALASEIACSVDPFCYLSHLSAMEHHGLTNRTPSKLFISSPGRDHWREYAQKKMQKDLADRFDLYHEHNLPTLTKIRMEKIGKRIVNRHNSIHLGAYKNVKNKPLRVSTIGRTFFDMIRNPELCGGIHHVLEVYEEKAATYFRLIVDEISANGGSIDKVRAGYILNERLGLEFSDMNEWLTHAKRGGSRKLDPANEYMPVFSEKWCLSINTFV